MRATRFMAALVLLAFLLAPTTSAAIDWAEWKRLIRHRPVAVLVAIPPMIIVSPFMFTNWLLARGDESDDDDDE